MKYCTALLSIISLLLILSACHRNQRICPEGSLTYLPDPNLFPALPAAGAPGQASLPVVVEIRGKMIEVDQVIQGPVCNNHLIGKVYIGCDIEIAEWEEAPRFFRDCDFSVEPGSVVYVAAHNDTAFVKGCACHTGELKF